MTAPIIVSFIWSIGRPCLNIFAPLYEVVGLLSKVITVSLVISIIFAMNLAAFSPSATTSPSWKSVNEVLDPVISGSPAVDDIVPETCTKSLFDSPSLAKN